MEGSQFQQAERSSIARILNQLVDQQQRNCEQFQQISLSLESIRAEIRRTDENHHKEVERLQEIINKMMQQMQLQLQISAKSQVQTPVVPMNPQQAYNAGNFFGDPNQAMMSLRLQQPQQMQLLQQQQMAQQQLQQLQLQQSQMQAALQAQAQGGLTSGLPTGNLPFAKPVGPSLAQTQLKAPPLPATGTVTLPISTPPKTETPKMEPPKVEPKKESTPTPSTTTPSINIFSKSAAVSSVPATSTTTPTKPQIGTAAASISSKPSPVAGRKEESKKKVDDDDEDAEAEEFEPTVDFKPVVPLPELIEVVTGEENETEAFKERCKLYRYASETKEWKERGTGDIKVLIDKSGNYRVVMRRDQIHKLCANFKLTKGMTISKMGKNTKACAWHCHDFSEEEGQHEQLSAKFASTEVADQFMKLFNEGVSGSKATPKASEEPKKSEGHKKDATQSAQAPKSDVFGAQFIKKEGEWDCVACYTRQPANISECQCCGTNKDGTKGEKDIFRNANSLPQSSTPSSSSFVFGLSKGTEKTPNEKSKFVFGLSTKEEPVVAPATSTTPATADKGKLSFMAAASVAAKEESTPVQPKATGFGSGSAISNFSFSGTPTGKNIFGGGAPAANSATKPTFLFAKKEEASSTTPSTTASPVSFSFKGTSSPAIAPGKSIFGASAISTPKEERKEDVEGATSTTEPAGTKLFGKGTTGSFSFAQLGSSGGSLFDAESKKKAEEELAKQQQKQSKFGANIKKQEPKAAADEDDEHGEGDEDEEYEPSVDFKPVIPLPDLVEVKTGEEDEEERCKLYRYCSDNKEWKERGTGDLKILKAKNGDQRIVMRRDQTHKVCANFKVHKGMMISVMPRNSKACQWKCHDFSEEVVVEEQLSAKFTNPETCEKFIKQFTNSVASAN